MDCLVVGFEVGCVGDVMRVWVVLTFCQKRYYADEEYYIIR